MEKRTMANKSPYFSVMLVCVMLLTGTFLHQAIGQSISTQPTSNAVSQPKPVSVPHLYWHFLEYQRHLDEVADARQKQGKDGQPVRDCLQNELGFSSVEYAQIHASAQRLTEEIKDINARGKAIGNSGRSAQSAGFLSAGDASAGQQQMKALIAEREADINAEIEAINLHLSNEQQVALQTYLVKKFSPSNARFRPAGSKTPLSTTGTPASMGVN
jgi:hypothetical protein